MNIQKPGAWTDRTMTPPDPKPEPGPIDRACDDVLLLQDGIRESLARVMLISRELTALRLAFIDGERYAESKSFSIGIPLTPEELMFAKRRQLNESLKDFEALLEDFRDQLRVLVSETLLPTEAERLRLPSAAEEPPMKPEVQPEVQPEVDSEFEAIRREMQDVVDGVNREDIPPPPEPKGFLARMRMRD